MFELGLGFFMCFEAFVRGFLVIQFLRFWKIVDSILLEILFINLLIVCALLVFKTLLKPYSVEFSTINIHRNILPINQIYQFVLIVIF